jgi:hypothetical protein
MAATVEKIDEAVNAICSIVENNTDLLNDGSVYERLELIQQIEYWEFREFALLDAVYQEVSSLWDYLVLNTKLKR